MKRVILFGASGLLGSELKAVLTSRGFDVRTPSHSEVDLRTSMTLESYIKKSGASYIINAAALIQVDEIEKDPSVAWQVNADAAGVIAKMATEIDATLIHISSQYVFDGSKPFYEESDITSPLNMYGETKAAGETLVQEFALRHHIVRTSWIYGERRPTFVDEVAKTLREGRELLASVEQRGNPSSAHDVALAIERYFISSEEQNGVYHLINDTQKEGVSRYEIAEEVAAIVGAPVSLVGKAHSSTIFNARRPSAVLVNTKLPPLPNWKEALRQHLKPSL
jgi:dTDP-4-dehydrorhamnose reductase